MEIQFPVVGATKMSQITEIPVNLNETTFEEREQCNRQLELVKYETDDDYENKIVVDENQGTTIKIEIKEEEMDIPCDCTEHIFHPYPETKHNVLEEVSVSCHNSFAIMEQLEHLKSELHEDSSSEQRSVDTLLQDKKFKCLTCHKKFKYACRLQVHMRIHTGKKPYACDICNYRCKRRGHLVRHKRTHTGEKPFACDICDYKCSLLDLLKRHKRTHTGEKPYPCDFCDYRCADNGNLIVHKRTHTGEKPYVCDICHCKFTNSGCLTVHKRRHTGMKSFACDICDYRCVRSTGLTNHKRIHTERKKRYLSKSSIHHQECDE